MNKPNAPGEGSELPALIMEIKQAAEKAQWMLDHCAIPGHGWDNNVWNAFTRAATPESILKLIELKAALSSPQPSADQLLDVLYSDYEEDGPFTHKNIRAVIDLMKSAPPVTADPVEEK